MTVIKKFVSILLSASLCIGSIFSVQGDTAFQASAAEQPMIAASEVERLLSQYSSDLNYSYCYDLLHNFWSTEYCCVFVYYDDYNWNFTVWRSSANATKPATQWQINTVTDGLSFHPRGYGYLQSRYFYCTTANGFKSNSAVAWQMWDRTYNPGNIPILTSACAPNDSNINLTTYKVYFSQNLYYGNNVNQASDTLAYYYNLDDQFGPPPPPGTQFSELVYFQLGDHHYLTVDDQDMLNTLKYSPNATGYVEFYIGDDNYTSKEFFYSDLSILPGAESQIDVHISNIKPQGLMALQVDDVDWISCYIFQIDDLWYDEWFTDWSCYNLPFTKPSDPETNQSASEQAWEAFLAYLNTYIHTQIVPGDLASQVFGITGSQCAPAWVSLPDDICNSGADYYPLEIRWGFNDLNQSLVNWDIMDVCCIAAGGSDYLVEYRLNALASPQQVQVAHMSLDEIFERFDVVIIVDGRTSSEVGNLRIFNGWYGSPTGTGIFDQYFGWTGANGSGIIRENLAVSPYDDEVTYHGFSFWTERGIAKQHLLNFNDGLENTYKLMSDYVFSTEEWRASFLMWSASVFYQLDSIGGALDNTKKGSIGWFLESDIKLSDYLNNILDKLDNLVNNTSVDEVTGDSWYSSLWRFIKRFDIQDSTFANWIDDIDAFFEELPDLPEVQPTIIPFPTYIPAPTEAAG